MASKSVCVVPHDELSGEVQRHTHFKHVVTVKQVTEESVISFQGAPNSRSKPMRQDWVLGNQALKIAQSKEYTRRRLINKLAEKKNGTL